MFLTQAVPRCLLYHNHRPITRPQGDSFESLPVDSLDSERRRNEAERKRDREVDHFQNAVDGYADDAEWQEQQPQERIRD